MAAAAEFLDRRAPGSRFIAALDRLFDEAHTDPSDALERAAQLLLDWTDYVEAGLADALPPAVQARVDAATDLMEQVQQLVRDSKVHPAAPVVLAGAAFEELLRSLVLEHGLTVPGKPGMQTYATSLRSADVISAQAVKDVTSWSGQRNEAAHGHFENLSKARAQIMVDGINLFRLQQRPVTTP